MLLDTGGDVRGQGDAILRLIHNKVGGMVIVPAPEPMPAYQIEVLRERNIPIVFCHRRTTELNAPLITWPWEEVGRLAAATLADLGHTKIGFLDTAQILPVNRYVRGMQAELSERGIELPESRIFLGENPIHRTTDAIWDELLSRVLDSPDQVTGIFCADDYVSESLYVAAMQRGLRVPEDLSIIGFGPTWRGGALREKLAAVTVDETKIGRCAAEMLSQMQTGRLPLDCNETITIDVKVHKGASLGAPSSQ